MGAYRPAAEAAQGNHAVSRFPRSQEGRKKELIIAARGR